MKTKFVVHPVGFKARYYEKLDDIPNDFSQTELEGALIIILYNSVVVGYLDTPKIINEAYEEKS